VCFVIYDVSAEDEPTNSRQQVVVEPTSAAIIENGDDDRRPRVRAIYSYLSSGDHQLSFVEGDVVALIGT
jgi:hypothetical protein